MHRYRLRRSDARNIVLERLGGKDHQWSKEGIEDWRIVAYCGNNIKAILREVSEAIMGEYNPDDRQELSEQLKELSRIAGAGYDKVEVALRDGDLLEV